MLDKNLINQYNKANTILLISSYPDRKNGIKNLNAVAWYAQKTFKKVAEKRELKFVVLAEKINKPEVYKDGNILVVRCWKRNSPFFIKDILSHAKKFNKSNKVLIEFEFNIFGGVFATSLLPLLLIGLKLLNKRITLELHQVILDLNQLSGHLNIKKRSLLSYFFNIGLRNFYRTITGFSDKVIVLEEKFKERLGVVTKLDKVIVAKITTTQDGVVTQKEARKRIAAKNGEVIVLFFGFVTWYKGADWLVKAFRNIRNKKIKLIMAGGESPTLKDKEHYKKLYRKILDEAEKSKNIEITGFVEEKDIPYYFKACDLVVLPYRTFMSSSGPLSWALSYKKPFLLSSYLEGYFESRDFKRALMLSKLNKEDILFSLRRDSFSKKINHLVKNPIYRLRLASFSSHLSQMRDPQTLTKLYLEELAFPQINLGTLTNEEFTKLPARPAESTNLLPIGERL